MREGKGSISSSKRHPGGLSSLWGAFMDFSKLDGLIPAVVQDAASQEVLMVGFMNRAHGTSRWRPITSPSSTARNTLWTKGETSGNRLRPAPRWTATTTRC